MLAMADFGRDPRSSDSWRARRIFLLGKERTISTISRRRNFTTFDHNTSIGVAMKTVGTEFSKFYRNWSFFPKKNSKITPKNLTSCDFRPP